MYLDTIQLTAGISVVLSTITVTLKCFQDDIKIYGKVKCEIRIGHEPIYNIKLQVKDTGKAR